MTQTDTSELRGMKPRKTPIQDAKGLSQTHEVARLKAVNAQLLEAALATVECDGRWPDGNSDRAMALTRDAIKAATES